MEISGRRYVRSMVAKGADDKKAAGVGLPPDLQRG